MLLKPSSTSTNLNKSSVWMAKRGLCRGCSFPRYFQGCLRPMARLCSVEPTKTPEWNQMKYEKVSSGEQVMNCVWTFLLLRFTASRLPTSADRIFICWVVPQRHQTFSKKIKKKKEKKEKKLCSLTFLFCFIVQPPVQKPPKTKESFIWQYPYKSFFVDL